MRYQPKQIFTHLFIVIALSSSLSCEEKSDSLEIVPIIENPLTEPETSITIQMLKEASIYPNHDTLRFSVDLNDEFSRISSVQILINDSSVQLPFLISGCDQENGHACYYWYDDWTLPIGIHSIKAMAYANHELVASDSMSVEIEDFRNKYVGDYHFTSINCHGDTVHQFDGWVNRFESSDTTYYNDRSHNSVNNAWSGNPPPKRRLSINYEPNDIVTPVLTQYSDGSSGYGYGYYGVGLYGRLISEDTVVIYYSGCGKYGYSGTSATGIKKKH